VQIADAGGKWPAARVYGLMDGWTPGSGSASMSGSVSTRNSERQPRVMLSVAPWTQDGFRGRDSRWQMARCNPTTTLPFRHVLDAFARRHAGTSPDDGALIVEDEIALRETDRKSF